MTMAMAINISSNPIVRLIGMYCAWIIFHNIAAHLYVYLCAPLTFMGFIVTPFVVAAPHCQALRWVVYNGGITVINMWAILGAWIASKIIL